MATVTTAAAARASERQPSSLRVDLPKTPSRKRAVDAPAGPTFDFLRSKTSVPAVRTGTVPRTALVNRLRAATHAGVVTVVAPAGYGKTTLLAQWAARDARQFAWVTIDERDNDPVVFLRHIAAALERRQPLDPAFVDALRAPGESIWTAAVPRLAAQIAQRSPIVLVLDDFNVLHSRASLDAVAALIDDESRESILVLGSRAAPRLRLAAVRAGGGLVEFGTADLALTVRDAQLLLRETGVRISEARTASLVERCEGWAAALYLAALSIRDGNGGGEPPPLRGDERYLSDYFRSEYLSQLQSTSLQFLRRTSLLDRMSGPLCDALLQTDGSGRELETFERENLFVVPLDDRREWYRYHHLFRGLLQRELGENEPELADVLHARAADWLEANGDEESALEHAYTGGDTDRAAEILGAIALPMYHSGRVATLERWLRRFERAGLLEQYPSVVLLGCWVHMLRGRPEDAERWLETAERSMSLPDRSRALRPWLAVLQAWSCRAGAERMRDDAELALADLPKAGDWRAAALAARGSAQMLLGDYEAADEILAEAADCAAVEGSTEVNAVSLGERALIATALGHHDFADELSGALNQLLSASGLDSYAARAIEHATTARSLLRHGRWSEARDALTAGRDVIPFLTVTTPWLAVRVRIELCRGFVTLRDSVAATELMAEIADLLGQVSDLGVLGAQADELKGEIEAMPEPQESHRAGLSPAELRLLPLLATHLTFREIAQQLYVSRNTIKTQAISVYRKLGVSSRSEAVAKAHKLGLEEHLRVVITNGS